MNDAIQDTQDIVNTWSNSAVEFDHPIPYEISEGRLYTADNARKAAADVSHMAAATDLRAARYDDGHSSCPL